MAGFVRCCFGKLTQNYFLNKKFKRSLKSYPFRLFSQEYEISIWKTLAWMLNHCFWDVKPQKIKLHLKFLFYTFHLIKYNITYPHLYLRVVIKINEITHTHGVILATNGMQLKKNQLTTVSIVCQPIKQLRRNRKHKNYLTT